MGLDGILRTAKQVFYREVPLDEFAVRLDIPAVVVDVGYLQSIEFQFVCDIGDELKFFTGLPVAELYEAQVLRIAAWSTWDGQS